eukprot:CAMPEP_0195283796 /NCGR_PEP_ID=MMETSP0707-20130614/2223_1 /TAXON_ID=33640 /ORGANISM="Asterionellopsis glacialis, Strain CCMP134" /LENGTH=233 /DNA_ID=CAMNT_0040343031 /DNA_START=84 /DNA_END=785 /DNA_ORIENTATION=+
MTSLPNSIVAKEGLPAKPSAWKPHRRGGGLCSVAAGYIIGTCAVLVAYSVAAIVLPAMWGLVFGLVMTHPVPAPLFILFLLNLFSVTVVFLVFIESTRLSWVGMFEIAIVLERYFEPRRTIQTETPNNLLIINDDNVAMPNPWHPATSSVTIVWLLHLSWTCSILFGIELPSPLDHNGLWMPILAVVFIAPRLLTRSHLGREVLFCMLACTCTFVFLINIFNKGAVYVRNLER